MAVFILYRVLLFCYENTYRVLLLLWQVFGALSYYNAFQLSAVALNNFSGKVIGTAVICSFLFILPYDLLFLRQQDDTRME